jgi:hypothetical protein
MVGKNERRQHLLMSLSGVVRPRLRENIARKAVLFTSRGACNSTVGKTKLPVKSGVSSVSSVKISNFWGLAQEEDRVVAGVTRSIPSAHLVVNNQVPVAEAGAAITPVVPQHSSLLWRMMTSRFSRTIVLPCVLRSLSL